MRDDDVEFERERAELAETSAKGLLAREQLIEAVTNAARLLLGAGDLSVAITEAVSVLACALAPARLNLIEDIPKPNEMEPGEWICTHEWYRPGLTPQIGSDFGGGGYPSRAWWEKVCQDRAVILPAKFDYTSGPYKILTTPVPGPVRRWLTVCFEDSAQKQWSGAELAVLQTAAACIGAALHRRDVEAARLSRERQRTDEALALSRLLEGVVAASRVLLEAEDFETGMHRWLSQLAQALDAKRAMYRTLERPFENGGPALQQITWAKSTSAGLEEFQAHLLPAFEGWVERLERGESVWAHRSDLTNPRSVHLCTVADVETILLVPVFLDGRSQGFLAFDWENCREWRPAFGTVLRTAADGAAAAIKREEVGKALIAERDRSANERSAELAKANKGMQRTLAGLAKSQDINAFLATALLELHKHAGAFESYLFVTNVEDGGLLRLRASVRGDAFQVRSRDDDPPHFAAGFLPRQEAYIELLTTGRMIWREIEPATESSHRHTAIHQWHLAKGHKAYAKYLLQVGDRVVGMVGMAFKTVEPFTQSQCELLVALSQPIALALELSRLAEVANLVSKDRAVLAERNRMARDVHDTLAQGFTAISLQLQAASLASSAEERDRFIARAAVEAKTNVAASRRTIRLLRGFDESGAGSQEIVSLLEEALSSRLAGSSVVWRVLPLQSLWGDPPVNSESRRELKRVAQEVATNVLKHSGATLLEVKVVQARTTLKITFTDDGDGFDMNAKQEGFGLLGMRERADRMGATLQVESRIGGPTSIVMNISFKKTEGEAA